MRTATTNTRRPAYYSIQEAAWILGVEPLHISRTIRLGTLRAQPRHGRLMVPVSALTQLLGDRTDDRTVSAAKTHAKRGQPAEHRPRPGGTA